jgi:Ala-tRNA(Pro) deacylase
MGAEMHTRLLRFLEEQAVSYRLVEHQAAGLSAEVSRVRGTNLHQDAKALVLEVSGGPAPYVLAVAPADYKVHTKRLRKLERWRDAKLAERETVRWLTGCDIGEVPPFGSLLGMPTYVDERLFDNDEVAFNAGEFTTSIIMPAADYRRICGATVLLFARKPEEED